MTPSATPGGPDPLATVILTVRNDADVLRDCLSALTRMRHPEGGCEILAVDNGSTDRSAEILGEFPVTYLLEPRKGVSWARNCGIDAARGEIIAFTDPDCAVSTDWLRRLVRGFSDPRVGCVAGGIVPFPPRTFPELHAARRRSHTQQRPLRHPVRPYVMTPNVAFRRSVFEQIGRFDTDFPGGGFEDADLCWRLTEQTDFRIEYVPEAVVFHRYRDTYGEFFVQQYRYGFGLGTLARKYRLTPKASRPTDFARKPWVSGLRLTDAAVRFAGRRLDRETLALRYLDLLRSTAQQAGWSAARLPVPAWLSRRRA